MEVQTSPEVATPVAAWDDADFEGRSEGSQDGALPREQVYGETLQQIPTQETPSPGQAVLRQAPARGSQRTMITL